MNTGSLYLIRDIGTLLPGAYDLNGLSNFYRRYDGGSLSDYLGANSNGGDSVFWGDSDGDGYSNDLFIGTAYADTNSKSDAGALYVLPNQSFGGLQDYSFVLSLPSSGCTLGNGNLSGGSSCQKGYLLASSAYQQKVDPEGQSSSVPFFVFDNQSSTLSDFNMVLDLNASLPSTISLKAALDYSRWFLTCTNSPSDNCVLLSDDNVSMGKLKYSSGSLDLNVWFWGDFVGASDGNVDRNVSSGATEWG